MSEYRISKVCPHCGCTTYRKVRPKAWIAFIDDRVCLECTERYTPPTPAWASICFIVIGILFIAPLPLGVGIDLLSGRGGSPGGWVCYALLAALGVAAIGHGIRTLSAAGKA